MCFDIVQYIEFACKHRREIGRQKVCWLRLRPNGWTVILAIGGL